MDKHRNEDPQDKEPLQDYSEEQQLADDTSNGINILFPEDRPNRLKTAAVATGSGVLVVASAAGIYFAQKNGVNLQEIVDAQYVPQPRVYPEIVDGFVATNNALRTTAPIAAAAGLSTQLGLYVAGKRSEHARAVNQLALSDYAGTEGFMNAGGRPTVIDRMRRRSAAVGVGLIATFTAAMTGGMSGVEHELSNGPLRPVERTFDMLSNGSQSREIIVQSPDITFMDDSWVDRNKLDSFAEDAAAHGITVIPFRKNLPNIDGRSGLTLMIPDGLYTTLTGESTATSENCNEPSVILDEANTTPVGSVIDLNGNSFTVAEKISATAQMNRDVAIMSESSGTYCVEGVESQASPYFGAIISGETTQAQLDALLAENGLSDEAVAISEDQFNENNREFWRKNGTPIILQVIGCVGVLGGAAMMALRRGKLVANAREIAVMRGQGVSNKDIRSAEMRRSLRETAASTVLAVPFMYGLAASFNAAEVGLKVGVGLREMLSGYTVTLLANVIGSRRSAKYLEKNLDIAEAVKKG